MSEEEREAVVALSNSLVEFSDAVTIKLLSILARLDALERDLA